MKLNNREHSSLKAPKVSDNEIQRALEKIYEDLNELKDATNKADVSSSQDYEGKIGDIKIVKTGQKFYNLHVKGEEGWVSAKLGKNAIPYTLVGKRQKTDEITEEIDLTGATGATGQAGAEGARGPAGFGVADYESPWTRAEFASLYYGYSIPALDFFHNFNEFPYILKIYYAPSYNPNIGGIHGNSVSDVNIDAFVQIDTAHVGSSSAGEMKYGTAHIVTKQKIALMCGSGSVLNVPTNLLGDAMNWHQSSDGAFKILAWKKPNE